MKVSNQDASFFFRENIINVNAAILGTRINDVEKHEANESEEQALGKMSKNRFDVLPIKSENSLIKEYFQTDSWGNYSSISRKAITHKDFIPLHTHVRDIIKGLASAEREKRPFYFLSHENRTEGLLTIADLNRRQVRIYLYSLISELEILLSHLISSNIPEEDLLNIRYGDEDEKIKKKYKENKAKGVELPFVEYLYLSNLINIAKKDKLYLILGYTSKKKFEKDFNPLICFRNTVAHPTRSIVKNEESVKKLWRRIDRIEGALFKLRHIGADSDENKQNSF